MRICIRSGMTRHVLLIRRWAFKVPRFSRYCGELNGGGRWRLFVCGVYHNLTEWRDGREPGEQPFARTLWSLGGFLNCMERAEPLQELPPDAFERLDWSGRRDLRLCNVGLIGDRLVLVDYA